MRYAATGEVHKDFHLATDTTIRYVLKKYDRNFLAELFRRTAQKVYVDIYDHLKGGDPSELLGHWKFFLEREGGDFTIEEEAGAVRLYVKDCPAARHLAEGGRPVSPEFHLQTILMNNAWAEGTPFEISTEVKGERECLITLRRKTDAAK